MATIGKPLFAVLTRRYTCATLLSLFSINAFLALFGMVQNRIAAVSLIFMTIFLFGFSIVGVIVSFVSMKRGLTPTKGLLLAAVNALPTLIMGGFWIYFEIIKKG